MVLYFFDLPRVLFRDSRLAFWGNFVGVACLRGDEASMGAFVKVILVFEERVRGLGETMGGSVVVFFKKK